MTYDIPIPDDNYSMLVASSSIIVSNQIHLTIHAFMVEYSPLMVENLGYNTIQTD
jgi:hypothetical protein